MKKTSKTSERERERVVPEETCKHKFVKYPPKIGKLKVCEKCGFLWVLGDVKFGEHSIKLSGSGNYIEANTTTAPASPASGKIRFYATSDTDMKMKNSAGTETDLAAQGALYNYLTNPGFEIWQRGTGAFTASGAYSADRWYLSLGGTSTQSVTKETTTVDSQSKVALKCVYVHNVVSAISQQLADPDGTQPIGSLKGQAVTFSIRVRASAANAIRPFIQDGVTTTYGSYQSSAGAFQTLTVSATISATATQVRVGVELDASDTFYLDNATLVLGSTAQSYYGLTDAEEWERCQRYYMFLQAGGVGASTSINYSGYIPGAVSSWYTQTYPTRTAVSPTVTKVGTWGTVNCGQPTFSGNTAGVLSFILFVTAAGAGIVQSYGDSADDGWTVEANP